MNCNDSPQWISDWLDGALQPLEERMLMAHLEQCPECAALWEQLTTLHTACSDLPELSAPEGFAQGVMARVHEEGAPKAVEETSKVVPLFRRPQVRKLAGLAACAVLCFGLGGVMSRMTGGGSAESAPMAAAPMKLEVERAVSAQAVPESAMEETGAALSTVPESTVNVQDCVEAPAAGEAMQPGVIVTLERLPEGAEEILGENPDWQQAESGLRVCTVTLQQGEKLLALAREQGIQAQVQELSDEQAIWNVQMEG